MRLLGGILRRELTVFMRRPTVWLLPPLFFLLVATIFAVVGGDSPAALQALAPAVIWSAALLAGLLSQEGIFRPDDDNGFIEQALLSAQPLPLFVLAKVAAHWLLTGLPLTLMSPLAALLVGMSAGGMPTLLLTLPLGTAVLSLLASFAAALTLGQKNPLLATLLVMPLCIPVLIFSVAAVAAALSGFPVAAPLSLLAALVVLSLTLLPLATAGVLRVLGGGR